MPTSTTLFQGTVTNVVTNATTDTPLLATGTVGSMSLPPSFWNMGRGLRLDWSGSQQTPATPVNCTYRLQFNNTVICFVNLLGTALTGSSTSNYIGGLLKLCCRGTGSSGLIVCSGYIEYQSAAAVQLPIPGLPGQFIGIPLFPKAPMTTKDVAVPVDLSVVNEVRLTQMLASPAAQGTTVGDTTFETIN